MTGFYFFARISIDLCLLRLLVGLSLSVGLLVCFLFPNLSFSQMEWLGISTTIPNSYAVTGIRTHVSRVAPDRDLSDALLTDLHGHGLLASLVK